MNVLDHGYVHLVESWGSDERIIEAARMSTQKGFEGWGPKPRKAVCPKHGQVSVQSIMLDETDVHEYVHIECGAACDVESESGDEKSRLRLSGRSGSTPRRCTRSSRRSSRGRSGSSTKDGIAPTQR